MKKVLIVGQHKRLIPIYVSLRTVITELYTVTVDIIIHKFELATEAVSRTQ